MKKKDLYALACIFWFAGCSSPASDEIEIVQNLFPVQFSVQLQKEILPFSPTRSMPPNTVPEPVVPDEDNPEKELSDLCSHIEYVVFKQDNPQEPIRHHTYNIDSGEDFGIVYDTLAAGNYQVCFLAHSSEDIIFSENILSFDEVSDSFYHSENLIVGQNEVTNEYISLKRIIGKIEFRASDPVPDDIKTFEITVDNYPESFNIQTGKGIISSAPYHLSHSFTEEDKLQSGTSHSFLSFIPGGDTKISVVLTSIDISNLVMRTRTISDIFPILNKTIRYTGVLYTRPQTDEPDNTFQLTIGNNGKWDATVDKELPAE